ncbi:Ankyrin repeat and SOCS box protein 8 [Crenichthys baileyi]|uniref:Ankyrin repeat and SOCS box protein 8 n=3 Tax=Goodeidae TaxID=28758 RepID=A0AAV9RX25_9TELE
MPEGICGMFRGRGAASEEATQAYIRRGRTFRSEPCAVVSPLPGCHGPLLHMSSTMWYIMQSIQSKYSLSERLIRTIAAIRSFPHDNVEDLIRKGADVNRMHGTLKPLHCACMVADADCVELLLEKGAEVNALDGYNRTALHYAAEKDESCVELLLEYGAQPNALDGNKDTPLHWAAFKDNPECVRALLESSACPNARDYNNDTPLSWAAMKGNLESVKVLLDYGAQVHVTNLKGQTPISRLVALLARGLGTEQEEECLELLCRAAGRFEIRRADGTLPKELSKDPQLLARLTNMVAQAPTLRSLARCAVRQSLGMQFLPTAVKELPLPEMVKDYLLLRD